MADHTLGDYFGPNGLVAQHLDFYEDRPEQGEMALGIDHAVTYEHHLIAEGGTGIGKTFAYLIPLIQYALDQDPSEKQPVVVSTATINLQEQIAAKDLPFLTALPGLTATFAVVKGKANYLCLQRARDLEAKMGEAEYEQTTFHVEQQNLLVWAAETKTGDKSELPAEPTPGAWTSINVDEDSCPGNRCALRQQCHFFAARERMGQTDVLIANHHILLADLNIKAAGGGGVLPEYSRLVIDEAHHLYDTATQFFGDRISFTGIFQALGRICHTNRDRGSAFRFVAAVDKAYGTRHSLPALKLVRDLQQRAIREARIEAELVHNQVKEHVAQAGSWTTTMRVTEGFRQTQFWGELKRAAGPLLGAIRAVDEALERLLQAQPTPKPMPAQWMELHADRKKLAKVATTLDCFVNSNADQDVHTCRWIECRSEGRKNVHVTLEEAPIEVAECLRGSLFESDEIRSVVLTSATLAVAGGFDFIRGRLGINQTATMQYRSPFPYRQHAKLLLPTDMPDPRHRDFEPMMVQRIADILHHTQGGTLVLFTSFAALDKTYRHLEHSLNGVQLLKQGGGLSRARLLEKFIHQQPAVLLATASFWEGIDVRGEALRCVIIAKLPFKVPTEPIEEARVELIEKRGGNPFMELSVPETAIRLQQGFGRLIRSHTDLGSVVLLDSRVMTKPYGQYLLRSLPPAQLIHGLSQQILTRENLVWA